MMRRLHRRQDAGQRAIEMAILIADGRIAECCIVCLIAVGADQQFIDQRGHGGDGVTDQRAAVERQQALVQPAHAPRHAAGQHDAADFVLPAHDVKLL